MRGIQFNISQTVQLIEPRELRRPVWEEPIAKRNSKFEKNEAKLANDAPSLNECYFMN